jgi:hypothetical protein
MMWKEEAERGVEEAAVAAVVCDDCMRRDTPLKMFSK